MKPDAVGSPRVRGPLVALTPAAELFGGSAAAGEAAAIEAPAAEAPAAEAPAGALMPWLVETTRSQAGPNAAAVRELQSRLKAAGFDPGPVDGWLGPRTAAALRGFQRARGLVVDAQCGPQTWGALGLPGAPRTPDTWPGAPDPGPNQQSALPLPGLPPAGPLPAGSPHDRRQEWFLSQQPGIYNPNEDAPGNGNCGPAAVTMVARAFGKVTIDAAGVDAAVEETRRRIGGPQSEYQGTSIAGLQKALQSYGLNAQVKSSRNIVELIQAELAQGRLVIAHVKATYLRPNPRTGHYTVVTAIRDGMVYLNDSSNRSGPMAISIADFEKAVAARGSYTIISAAPS